MLEKVEFINSIGRVQNGVIIGSDPQYPGWVEILWDAFLSNNDGDACPVSYGWSKLGDVKVVEYEPFWVSDVFRAGRLPKSFRSEMWFIESLKVPERQARMDAYNALADRMKEKIAYDERRMNK